MNRRDFLTVAGGTLLAGGAWAYGVSLLAAPRSRLKRDEEKVPVRRRGMVIDLDVCISGCTDCVEACREENNVYKAEDGDDRWDIYWIRKVKLRSKEGHPHGPEREILLLCNHCDNPPCAQVCPVQATYKRKDGIVIVDHHRCIGCRYCLIACPYNARQFNFRDNEVWRNRNYPKRSHGVAESCTLCAHRLDSGRTTACVEACERACKREYNEDLRAIHVGDLDYKGDRSKPEAKVSNMVADHPVKRIREDLGTQPKVYYKGF